MSNIDVQNIRYGLDRKILKVLGMSIGNYVGTYNFIVRQTINYEKKASGADSNKFITVISNPEGNYIDYVKGKRKDKEDIEYGNRCVFIKGKTLITGDGVDPNIVLFNLKLKAVAKILINILSIMVFVYLGYIAIRYFTH